MCVVLAMKDKRTTRERDSYRNQCELLTGTAEKYRTSDSLSAARVRSLELSLEAYERLCADDAALIKSLKQKNRDLASVNDIQAQTIIDLQCRPRDTVVVIDSIPVPAKAVRCGDAWYDFEGIVTADNFAGRLAVRDSLIVSESVQHARFLGFLWKTHRIKNRQVDVVSRNPHTNIDDVIYVIIED